MRGRLPVMILTAARPQKPKTHCFHIAGPEALVVASGNKAAVQKATRLIGIGWLVGWLAGWLAGWLVSLLVAWMVRHARPLGQQIEVSHSSIALFT